MYSPPGRILRPSYSPVHFAAQERGALGGHAHCISIFEHEISIYEGKASDIPPNGYRGQFDQTSSDVYSTVG